MTNSDTPECENPPVSPNKPKTPTVSVRIDPELWKAAVAKAARRGETVSDVIRQAVREYVEEPEVQVSAHMADTMADEDA